MPDRIHDEIVTDETVRVEELIRAERRITIVPQLN
jgi:hypothetical protein